jgi:hypothetical protein
MRLTLKLAILSLCAFTLTAQRPWQQITVPPVREAAANFKTPPREYGAIRWLTNGGEITQARIVAELDEALANGVFVVNIGWGSRLKPKYLSPEQLALAKFAVEEAKKRGMKVWIQDEGNYPSGLAGGLINTEYPQLRMQAIVADLRASVAAGQTLTLPMPPGTLGAFSVKGSDQSTALIPLPAGDQFEWTAPSEGSDPNQPNWLWTVVFVRHVYRSSPARSSNRADGNDIKDGLYSLIDYLDPDATRAFLKTTHEKYQALFGDEFGKTVLGFFGDETDYNGFIPWTPKLLEEFQKQKGYDLKPYIPMWFMGKLTGEAQRAKADYYDVWSGMFATNFFDVLADWNQKNNMEDLRHIGASSVPIAMIHNEGDFFRVMRHVNVPGIDNLNRIGPGLVANWTKLASSAAHLFGRPKAWEEEGGGDGESGKFVADYHFARGVTALQLRAGGGFGGGVNPQTSAISWYVNRLGYLLSIGRPAAQVALYYPTNSVWMGDDDSIDVTFRLTQQLLERQIDFDYLDEQVLTTVGTLDGGGLKNLSGQVYRGIVIPSSTVITRAALDRLRTFAAQGGKVVFVGRTPTQVIERTFLKPAAGAPDLSFAVLEPAAEITARVVQALPQPDVALDRPCPPVRYNHRSLADAQVYYFFNEGNQRESRTAVLAGGGQPQLWDAGAGTVHPMTGATVGSGAVTVPLSLEPFESKVIVLGPLPAGAAEPTSAVAAGWTLLELSGDWAVTLGDRSLTTPLKSWEDLGVSAFAGTALYRKEFTAPVSLGPVFLECENVRDYARVRLNGVDLDARGWRPYRWEITKALKPGANVLEIEVRGAGGSGGRGAGRGGAAPVASGLLPAVRLTTFGEGSPH